MLTALKALLLNHFKKTFMRKKEGLLTIALKVPINLTIKRKKERKKEITWVANVRDMA